MTALWIVVGIVAPVVCLSGGWLLGFRAGYRDYSEDQTTVDEHRREPQRNRRELFS